MPCSSVNPVHATIEGAGYSHVADLLKPAEESVKQTPPAELGDVLPEVRSEPAAPAAAELPAARGCTYIIPAADLPRWLQEDHSRWSRIARETGIRAD